MIAGLYNVEKNATSAIAGNESGGVVDAVGTVPVGHIRGWKFRIRGTR